jgi:hypothetical protein
MSDATDNDRAEQAAGSDPIAQLVGETLAHDRERTRRLLGASVVPERASGQEPSAEPEPPKESEAAEASTANKAQARERQEPKLELIAEQRG